MKKMIAAMLLGMSLMVSVTGCGTESTESKTEQSSSDAQKAETEKDESEKEEESTSSDVAPVSAFEYELTDDGNAKIISYDGMNEYKEVIIPDEIDGHKVTELGYVDEWTENGTISGLFTNDTTIEKVTISDSVEVMGPNLFANCTNLKEVIIGANVKEIQEMEFMNTAIEEITLPESLEKLRYGAFTGCYSLKSAIVGNKLTNIDQSNFKLVNDNFTLKCPSGSAAETYAIENEINYVTE